MRWTDRNTPAGQQVLLERRLRVTQVMKRYGDTAVLRGASMEVCPGQVLGLIGANGTGKTTLLRILLGLVAPDAGRVTLNGDRPALALRRCRVSYFAGGSALPGHARVRQWSALFTRESSSDRRRIGELSRGQRQLVGLRAALAHGAFELVVLDEPWEGLDPEGAEWLSARVSECQGQDAMTIISSHRLADLAGVCDSYAVLHRGRLTIVDAGDIQHRTQSEADRLRATYMALTCTGSRT